VKFDLGDVLSSAFQVTWKHKILWLFNALPVLVSFVIFPFVFVPIFFIDENGFGNPNFLNSPLYFVLFMAFSILISLLSYVLYGISSSAVILGILRADKGEERLAFGELFNDSKPYWLRVLGVLLLIGLVISVGFLVIFGCLSLFGMVTAGIGFICITPLMILIYPLMMVLYGFIEESQVAVVADDLGVTDAIRRGWELVRNNFWGVILASLVVYFGLSILSSIVIFPLMSPMFIIPFLIDTQGTTPDPSTLILIIGGFSLLFFPVLAVVQGVGITFLKSVYTFIYVRVLKPVTDDVQKASESEA